MTRKASKSIFDDEEREPLSLNINEDFAKRYEEKKRTEELGVLEDKYKEKLKAKGVKFTAKDEHSDDSSYTESDSESDAVEDEDGELVTPAVDVQILKTLAEIRAKDPKVYDPSTKFFDEAQLKEAEEAWRAKKREAQPMRLADYQRERLLSGKLDQDEENEEEEPLTHYEEQEKLKNDFKRALANHDNEEDDLFKLRPKTAEQMAKDEEDYKAFLLENLSKSGNAVESMNQWLDFKERKNVDPEEQFLIDYVLNRGWIDQERKALPSYDRLVEEDEEDMEVLEKAEEFETALNFRFEQPGAAIVQTYAREIEGTLRRKESKRKAEREAKKARKEAEKKQRQEELKRLKNLKKSELLAKVEKIKRVAGVKEAAKLNLDDLDLEDSDFDPAEHDRKMAKLFADEAAFEDEDKPVFDDLSDLSDNDGEGLKTKAVSKATKALKKAVKGDKEEPSQKRKVLERLDELYDLDYEDVIGDVTCRFRYTSVPSSSFGLKTEEILETEDALLNAHASLKRLAPYRPIDKQQADMKKLSDKRRLYQWRKGVKQAKAEKREARNAAKMIAKTLKKA
jgi:protein KRI1